MPLPTSGPIGADDINDDIGNQAGSQLDIDQVAIIVYDLSRPHGFDEFYGLAAGGAENIDVRNTPILIDSAGGVYQPLDTVRADDRYDIVVTYELDTELQWATGFIYSVSVLGTLGVYPNAQWSKTDPNNSVPFTGPFNSYRTLTFGSFPNDIGNYSRIGYINFVGSVTGVFVVQQQANLFWATVMGTSSWGFVIPQGSTAAVSPVYELTAGQTADSGGYNPESFFLSTTYAPTGEDPEDWIEGRSQKQANYGFTTWYTFRADAKTIFSNGPDDTIDIRTKQANNTYHDIVFTIYFNSDLIDKAQEGEWLNRLPVTVRLKGLVFSFVMTPSFTQIPQGGGSPTITFNLASGTWDNLSADRSWVTFGKTSGTANDSTVMTIGQNPETSALNITVSARSSVTGEYYSFIVSQAGKPLFTSSMIDIGNWFINSLNGVITLPPIDIPFDYPYTISYSSGFIPQISGWPVVSTPTVRGITVSVVVPNDGFYGNPGQTISNSSTRTQQPNHTITVDSISPTTLGNFAGAFTAITVTSSTTWSAQCYASGFRFRTSQGSGVNYESPSAISGTAGTRTVYVETTSSTTTSRTGRVYFYTDTGGGTDSASFTQEGQPSFNSSTWTGGVSINRNTGAVSISTGNSTTTPSVSPTSFTVRTTSSPNRTVTVSNVTAPSGYSNSGATLSPFTLSVTQLAATEQITISSSTGTGVSGQGEDFTVYVSVTAIYNTSWTASISYRNPNTIGWVYLGIFDSGTGDGSIDVGVGPNYPGQTGYTGGIREFRVTVQKSNNSGISDSIDFIQNTGTPPITRPQAYLSNFNSNFTWNATQYKTIQGSWSGGTPTTAGFDMSTSDFEFVQTDPNVVVESGIGGYKFATINNPAASTFSIGVRPTANNNGSSDKTATVNFRVGNSGGSTTASRTARQEYYVAPVIPVSWSRTPTSHTWEYNEDNALSTSVSFQNRTSNITWKAVLSTGTYFEISLSSSSGYGKQITSITNNDIVYMRPKGFNSSTRTSYGDLVTFSPVTSGTGLSNLSVSLTQNFDFNSGGACLIQGTKILLGNGSIKFIESLKVGDVLKTFNIDGMPIGEIESLYWKESDDLNYRNGDSLVRNIKSEVVDTIYSFNDGLLESSDSHQHFIRRGGVHQFIITTGVKVGDFLLNKDGEYIEIYKIDINNTGNYVVYKIDVEENDLYFANGILTHNAKIEF